LESILKYLDIVEELGNKHWIANANRMLGYYHYERGEYDKFLECLNKRLKIFEELNDERGISTHNFDLGDYYLSQRNYDKALECFEKVLEFFLDKKVFYGVVGSYLNIALVYKMKGDLHKALESAEKAHDSISDLKVEGWWTALPSLTEINLLLGNIDRALEYEEQILNLHKKTEYTLELAFSLSRISTIYWQKGLQDEAIEAAQESLGLLEETKNHMWIGKVLADLVFFSTEISNLELADKYLNQLKEITQLTKDKQLIQKFDFSEAIFLSKKENERDRMKASLLLENLLREELDYAFHVRVLLSLSEVIIKDLQETGEEDILIKLQKLVLDLYSIASTNKSFILIAETLLLQSKLALVELDKEKAESLLEQAFNIAEENGLDRLKESIIKEKEIFKEEKEKIERFDKETPIHEKIEAVDFKSRLNGVKKASLSIKQKGEQIMLKSLF
jgi:tetratricopeptide (TPR) repeat protein